MSTKSTEIKEICIKITLVGKPEYRKSISTREINSIIECLMNNNKTFIEFGSFHEPKSQIQVIAIFEKKEV